MGRATTYRVPGTMSGSWLCFPGMEVTTIGTGRELQPMAIAPLGTMTSLNPHTGPQPISVPQRKDTADMLLSKTRCLFLPLTLAGA